LYKVFSVGVTVTLIGTELLVKMVPSDNEPNHGPCPVADIVRLVLAPLHIVALPESVTLEGM
jgi:hypothetical protein